MSQLYLDSRGRPRVVITGMGMFSPIGHSVTESWSNALNGHTGIGPVTQCDVSDLPCKIAGEVKDFDPTKYVGRKESRRMSRASQLAVAATQEALNQAQLTKAPNPERTGVVIGTGIGGFEKSFDNLMIYNEKGLSRVNPFALASSLANMPSHYISILAETVGPISSVVSACASGTQAIGEGAELIRQGRADLVIAGGVEGLIHMASLVGFSAMRALTTNFNANPGKASRPFDKDREGFVLSEGAGILILERLDHALARNAPILAEFLGHASSSDAFHIAAPDPEAQGAVRAMSWALNDAALTSDKIDYINAHGTSTLLNDATETVAIKKLFGERAYSLPISSTKSIMGHAMGGAGAIETIFCIKAIEDSILPPTWNYETADPECDLDYIPNAHRPQTVTTALCNAFGLGGQNACVVVSKYQ